MRYYKHNQTMPVVKKGHKILSGDEFVEQDDGEYKILRNGKILFDSKTVAPAIEEVKTFVVEEVEKPKVNVKKKARRYGK